MYEAYNKGTYNEYIIVSLSLQETYNNIRK